MDNVINSLEKWINPESFKGIFESVFISEIEKSIQELQKEYGEIFRPNIQAANFIKKYTFENIEDMTDELQNDLRQVLQRGIMNGEPSGSLKEKVSQVFGNFKNRAETIARTELNRGRNYAKLSAMQNNFPELMIYPCSADSELALREAAKAELIDYIPGDDGFKIKGEISDKQRQALNKIKKDVLEVYRGTGVQEILNLFQI